jgi:hypothetical protein
MKTKERRIVKIRLNKNTLEKIVVWSISLGTLMAGLSLILGNSANLLDFISFTTLIISALMTSLYILLVQEKQSSSDKTKFFMFTMIICVTYIAILSIVSARYFYQGQLIVNAFWYRILFAWNFAISLVFWEFIKGDKVYKIPIFTFIIGVSLASIAFIYANIFNVAPAIIANKGLISILSAAVLAITMIQQNKLSTKKDKIIGFSLFVISSLAILLAQNIVAIFALSVSVIIYSTLRSIRSYKGEKQPIAFFSLLINVGIIVLLNTTYFLISTNNIKQFVALSPMTLKTSFDSIAVILIFSAFIGKFFMKELKVGSVAVIVLIIAALFTPFSDLVWISLGTLTALHLANQQKVKTL